MYALVGGRSAGIAWRPAEPVVNSVARIVVAVSFSPAMLAVVPGGITIVAVLAPSASSVGVIVVAVP